MDRPAHFIETAQQENAVSIHLKRSRLDESELSQLMDELFAVVDGNPGRNVILSLGPDEPIFLYSVFLAKLVRFQRRVKAANGRLKLADVSANILEIFQVCHLDDLFEIYPDMQSALASCAQTELD